LQDLGLKKEELEELSWEDLHMVLPFVLMNLFSNLKPRVAEEVR